MKSSDGQTMNGKTYAAYSGAHAKCGVAAASMLLMVAIAMIVFETVLKGKLPILETPIVNYVFGGAHALFFILSIVQIAGPASLGQENGKDKVVYLPSEKGNN